jgi:hypothetical protein
MKNVAIKSTAIALAALAFAGSPASAAYKTPTAYGVAKKAKVGVREVTLPGEQKREIFIFSSFRKPVLVTSRRRAILVVAWNGLDDGSFLRLAGSLLSASCGIASKGYADKLISGLYKTKSLIRGKQLGGNAGRSFHYRTITRQNGCRIVVEAKGGRWHKLTITVSKA